MTWAGRPALPAPTKKQDMNLITVVLPLFGALAQETPTDIPKSELPKAAVCVVCEANGAGHALERPVAGVRLREKSYFFCNVKEVAEFKKDPEAFLPPVLPRPAPALDLADMGGRRWTIEDSNGKTLLVDFWATWCGPCKEMKPVLEKVRSQFAERGFEVLGVSIDEKREDLEKFLAKSKPGYPVLHDTATTWGEWKVRVVPTYFLVRDGQIVRQWSGKVKEPELSAAVESTLPQG